MTGDDKLTLTQLEKQLVIWDAGRLKRHFSRVIRHLQKRDVSHLSPELQAARSRNIQYLQTYAAQGIFPHNPSIIQQPCFVDREGRACAVAYLLLANHQHEAVEEIRHQENLAYVPEMRSPLLQDWIAESGFTAQEVKQIQPSYIGAPTSVEFMQQLTQIGDGLKWIMNVVNVLGLAAVILGTLNLALLFRRRIGWRSIALGLINGLLFLSIALYAFMQLRIVNDIRSVICATPQLDCSNTMFHIPADLDRANWAQFNAAALLVMAIFFAVLVLLPSLIRLFWAMRKRRSLA